MFQTELKNYVASHPKLVTMRPAGDGIFVLKYKKAVFFDGLWNRFLEECRGTIVDADFNVVSRPFTKIYNYGVEKAAPVLPDSTPVTAYRKINGFMCAMTWHDGRLLVSTTGSTDSPFVKMVEDMMGENRDRFEQHCEFFKDFTWMFECVHPEDPHVVPEKAGLYLLGWRKKDWESRMDDIDPLALGSHALVLGTLPVESYQTTLGELKEMVKSVRHEGFVFYTADGVSSKIKSPYYLVNKFVARNPRTDKLMRPDVKQSLDEEYYPLIDAIQANIESYTALDEQARLAWVREFLGA